MFSLNLDPLSGEEQTFNFPTHIELKALRCCLGTDSDSSLTQNCRQSSEGTSTKLILCKVHSLNLDTHKQSREGKNRSAKIFEQRPNSWTKSRQKC